MIHNAWSVPIAVVLVNLPFGYWRAGTQKFTLPWFLAVHAPVPLVAALRIFSGLGWSLSTFPLLVGAFFTGQFLGGTFRNRRQRQP